MQQRTFSQWLEYIEAQHPQSEIELGLGRMREMVRRMALDFSCPLITVAGTNGKGSTCAMLESIYRAAGYRTGVHTSPHMLRFNERARIDGREVADEVFTTSFERVEALRGDLPLTYFEFTALAIMDVFQRAELDVIILEIGLGGRLDAINVLEPTAAIVTTVGIDHEAFLGNTRDSVGWEKAHVYRAGKPAICADANPPEKLLEYAYALGAELSIRGEHFDIVETETGIRFTEKCGTDWQLPKPALVGVNQIDNAAGVLAMVSALQATLAVNQEAVAQGLMQAQLTGRFEKVADVPLTYIDVGHNPHAAIVLAENLKRLPSEGQCFAVFGMLADKDMKQVVEIVSPMIDCWYVSGLPGPRGADLMRLTQVLKEGGVAADQIVGHETVEAALDAARQAASSVDKIIIFGSFVTVTAVLPIVKPNF